MNRREFISTIGVSLAAMPLVSFSQTVKKPMNVLIITADDLNWDSLGVTGCKVPNITPNIDKLASQGMLFGHAHVMTSICGPSRNALLSGRYPHCSGAMGHTTACPPENWQPPMQKTPYLPTYLQDKGFFTGAIHKFLRLRERNFDVAFEVEPWGLGKNDRDPQFYYQQTMDFIEKAQKSGKPFFLYDNVIDPHWPWPDTKMEHQLKNEYEPIVGAQRVKDKAYLQYPKPSSDYKAEQISVPSFLPDVPEIRDYLVPYFNSVKRMDDSIGQILKAIDDCGQADNTIVFFLSDNGMTVPGGKWACYHSSTATPLMVRWPGRIKANTTYDDSPVSAIDIMPTIIEALGIEPVEGIEGRSFFDVLEGRSYSKSRDYVYTAFNWLADGSEEQYYPMRAIAGTKYLYIWNAFRLDKDFIAENAGGQDTVLDILKKYKDSKPEYAQKAYDYLDRPLEEFFDISKDPGCWHNLIDEKRFADEIAKSRKVLLAEMTATKDPELERYKSFLAG